MALRLKVGRVMREKGIEPKDLRAFAQRARIAPNTARSLYHEITTRLDMPIIDRVAKELGVRPMELFEEVPDESGQRMARPMRTFAAQSLT